MKILLLGKDGQVGWELQRSLATLGEVVACGREHADLNNGEKLRDLVRELAPQIVVNAAAYTAVDKAETEPVKAYQVNAEAVAVLAEECKKINAWFVHYSTDYVFDGSKSGFYTEEDVANPLSVYGKSKLQGEQAVQQSGCKHLIFRTSWVYATLGNNFAKTMLKLAAERDQLKIVSDQWGAPTSAALIADVTAICLARLLSDNNLAKTASGLYHLAAAGEINWHGYAQHVIALGKQYGLPVTVAHDAVLPIAASEYKSIAQRPANSRLDTMKLRNTFGMTMPNWKLHINRVISELAQLCPKG